MKNVILILVSIVFLSCEHNHKSDDVCIKVSEDYLMSVYKRGYSSGALNECVSNIRYKGIDEHEMYFNSVKQKDTIEFKEQIKRLLNH